jgi:molybdopterin-synthase adenylyltransferase
MGGHRAATRCGFALARAGPGGADTGGAWRTLNRVAEELSERELERYAEQIERIGIDAQRRLKGARAIVLGARATGSAAAAHLVACGVGYVGVVDGGAVAPADLCGQSVLYTPDVGSNRADAVVAKLAILNTGTQAESYPVDVEGANAAAILMGHDLALDCGAGLPLEEACDANGVALVIAQGSAARDGLRAAEEALELLAAPAQTRQGAPA